MKQSIRELNINELTEVSGGMEDCGSVPIYWDGNPFPISDPDFRFPEPPPKLIPKG